MGETRDLRTYAIVGAAMKAHRALGCGFPEPLYQEALAVQLELDGIPFHREVELPLFYNGRKLEVKYRVDFVCFDDIPVELKALAALTSREEAIAINYLKAGAYRVGLLLNFGAKSLQYRRFINSQSAESAESADASSHEAP